MANVTIRNLPQEIYEQLKRRASANRRSLNQEIVSALEQSAVGTPARGSHDLLQVVSEFRRLYQGPKMTPRQIDAAKRKGRP